MGAHRDALFGYENMMWIGVILGLLLALILFLATLTALVVLKRPREALQKVANKLQQAAEGGVEIVGTEDAESSLRAIMERKTIKL